MTRLRVVEGGRSKAPAPEVSFMPLRAALDWLTGLYAVAVSGKVWKALLRLGRDGASQQMDLVSPRDGARVPVSVKAQNNGASVIIRGAGFWCRVWNPERKRDDHPDASMQYSVEVQVQGTALGASPNSGVDVCLWWVEALEASIFRHHGPDADARARALDPLTRPGRFDVAVDVAVQGDGAAAWIEEQFFRGGNVNDAARAYVTRARTPSGIHALTETRTRRDPTTLARMKGTEGAGRTLYVGSVSEVCDYEKDKTRDQASEILRATLREACGWNGADRLLRHEVRVTREWFRDQLVRWEEPGDGAPVTHVLRGDRMTLRQFLHNAPIFARELVSRFRHTTDAPGVRRRSDRPDSPFQQAIDAGLQLFDAHARAVVTPWFQRVTSTRRDAALERSGVLACGAITRVMALQDMTWSQAVLWIARNHREPRLDHWNDLYELTRARHGLSSNATLAEVLSEDDPPPEAAAG